MRWQQISATKQLHQWLKKIGHDSFSLNFQWFFGVSWLFFDWLNSIVLSRLNDFGHFSIRYIEIWHTFVKGDLFFLSSIRIRSFFYRVFIYAIMKLWDGLPRMLNFDSDAINIQIKKTLRKEGFIAAFFWRFHKSLCGSAKLRSVCVHLFNVEILLIVSGLNAFFYKILFPHQKNFSPLNEFLPI